MTKDGDSYRQKYLDYFKSGKAIATDLKQSQ